MVYGMRAMAGLPPVLQRLADVMQTLVDRMDGRGPIGHMKLPMSLFLFYY